MVSYFPFANGQGFISTDGGDPLFTGGIAFQVAYVVLKPKGLV